MRQLARKAFCLAAFLLAEPSCRSVMTVWRLVPDDSGHVCNLGVRARGAASDGDVLTQPRLGHGLPLIYWLARRALNGAAGARWAPPHEGPGASGSR